MVSIIVIYLVIIVMILIVVLKKGIGGGILGLVVFIEWILNI